jgi:2,5-diamino-6-(ribosylamino)-4(3H)-pyrimidinone 5'-phosphate reductase
MEKYNLKIILSAAISIDGKIATRSGDSKLSSKKDLIRLHQLRSQVDAILIGKNTVHKDDPLLTVRYSKGRNPIRIVLDSCGTISNKSKILQTSNRVRTIIVVSKKITKKNLQKLKKFPVEIMIIGENQVNIKSLIKWEFIKNNLVDEFFITITPFILGGKDAITLVQGEGFDKIIKSHKLRLNGIKRLENDLFLRYSKL